MLPDEWDKLEVLVNAIAAYSMGGNKRTIELRPKIKKRDKDSQVKLGQQITAKPKNGSLVWRT